MGDRVRGEMAQITVYESFLLFCFRSAQKIEGEIPVVRVLVIRQILFPDDDIGHKIPVNEVFSIAPDYFEEACGKQ
jgi:hypothetical protein